MYTSRLSTNLGVLSAASKFWNPPRPTRCIHSRSAWMPSLVMLPFIQCHHTRGRAELGGFSKPCFRASVAVWPSKTGPIVESNTRVAMPTTLRTVFILPPHKGARAANLNGAVYARDQVADSLICHTQGQRESRVS